MSTKTVLLSGITGFIGSHLAEELSKKYIVAGLIRSTSDLWRYHEIKNDNIRLFNQDDKKDLEQAAALNPQHFIHTAWGGVAAGGRDNWDAQIQNVVTSTRMLSLAKEMGIKHIISFGSQAEYGIFKGRTNEMQMRKPVTAYGAAKLAALDIQTAFCLQNNITSNWFRLFSVYGVREDFNWFIPAVIKNALQNKSMELTPCEQRYDYLSATELSAAIMKVLKRKPVPGVYNLTSNKSRTLKSIVEKIRDKTGTQAKFNFGAMPYRPNQVMKMEGNSELFFNTFKFTPKLDFDKDIEMLIEYYKQKL